MTDTDTVNQTAPWSVDPVYIGDDVYNLTDVVTDCNDPDGNPYCVQINTGSQAMDGKIARRIVACVNACAGLANPEAVGDLLRITQNVARLTRDLHDSPKSLLSHLTQALPDIDATIAKAKGARL